MTDDDIRPQLARQRELARLLRKVEDSAALNRDGSSVAVEELRVLKRAVALLIRQEVESA